MTLRKKVLFYILLTLLTLAALEGISRLAYYLAFAEWYSLPPSLSAADPASATPDETAGLARQAPYTPRQHTFRISHPYYGFTALSPISPLNAMPPPQTNPETVLIALLGGSVARDAAPHLQQALTQYFVDQRLAKEPVVISLAYSAMKQPQQLHIAAFMLAMGGRFDIIVNLDGYNELAYSWLNFNKDVFPSFPYQWENLVSLTRDEIALAGQIRAARAQLSQLQQTAPDSPFRYTALHGIIHRYQLQQTQTRILQLNYALVHQRATRSLEQQGPYVPFPNSADLRQETIRVWYRSSALLSRLAAAAGADYYHFLQPNQYIPNSKPLSPEEIRNYYRLDRAVSTDYPNTYPLFQQFGQALQQQGVPYFDLTQIFNNYPETLYTDECCHLNPRGNELLAAAMVQRLAPALQRRAAAPASTPSPAGVLTVAAPLPLPPAPPTPPLILLAAPAAEPGFQVSLQPGNLLLYTRENCASPSPHTTTPFFLHITPADPADLPTHRHHGFANWDFLFTDAGFRADRPNGRRCIVERILPDYPIAHIRTGQFNHAGEIWSTEMSFPE